MFIKWIKRNKLKIITTGICSIAMALFTIVSFSCKTYAYQIDNNGNLVGDNILDMSSYEILERNNVDIIEYNNGNMVISVNSQATYSYIVFHFTNTTLVQNTQYTFSYNANSSDYTHYNNILLKYGNTGADENNYYYKQHIYENRNYYSTFNSENHTDLYLLIYVNANIGGDNTITLSNIMLNKGEYKEWEPYGIWYSQQNYNTLEDMYNNMLESTYPFKKDKININSVIFNGQDITTIYKQDYDYTINFQETTITINSRDFEYLPNYNNDPYGYELLQMICTYETPVQLTDVIAKSALSAVKESYCDVTFYLNTQIVTHLYLDNDMQDTDTQMLTGSTCTFDKIVFEIRISQDETQYNNYTTISSGGNFAQGYAQATTKYEEQMQNFSNEVSKRDNEILKLKQEIVTTGQQQYNIGYQEGYNVGTSNNNTLYNMIIRSLQIHQ